MKIKKILDADSIEFKLFDGNGRELFKWKKVPGNIKTGLEVLRRKGIKI